MADSSLAAIRSKIRKLTRSPSTNQITNADIDEYVNTFILYDFPEELRLFSLLKSITFYAKPNIERYTLDDLGWKDAYSTFQPPAYIAGYTMQWSQSEHEFYGQYPFTYTLADAGTGDGVTTNFAGTLSSIPVERNRVSFVSKINGAGIHVEDDGAGVLASSDGDGAGTINYLTGAWTIVWTVAPDAGEAITSQTVPYTASRPKTILFYNNAFILRPIPDIVYPVQLEAYAFPSELLAAGSEPELEQWWQYIAYGAAVKIFQDRIDMESVAAIAPEFDRQERLVLRRTIEILRTQRAPTIYSSADNINNRFNDLFKF